MGGLAPGQLKSRRGWHSSPRRLHYRFSFFDRGFKNSLREKLYQFCGNGAFSSPSTCGSLALSGPPNWPSPTPPPTKPRSLVSKVLLSVAFVSAFGLPFIIAGQRNGDRESRGFDNVIRKNAGELVEQGRQIFRFDTFGDEEFWGNTLKLHRAIAGSRFGGIGPGVSPLTALAVGLTVDSEALPADLVESISSGRLDLADPANTLALLRLNSVVGVT